MRKHTTANSFLRHSYFCFVNTFSSSFAACLSIYLTCSFSVFSCFSHWKRFVILYIYKHPSPVGKKGEEWCFDLLIIVFNLHFQTLIIQCSCSLRQVQTTRCWCFLSWQRSRVQDCACALDVAARIFTPTRTCGCLPCRAHELPSFIVKERTTSFSEPPYPLARSLFDVRPPSEYWHVKHDDRHLVARLALKPGAE